MTDLSKPPFDIPQGKPLADALRGAEAKSGEGYRQRDEEFRLLFAANPQAMWVFGLETLAFLEVNEAAVQQYGYSREEFLRATVTEILASEDVPLFLDWLREADASSVDAGEWRHRLKDDRTIWVHVRTRALDFQGRPARLVILEDVTARKIVEEQSARLAAIVESSEDAITALDFEGRLVTWNPAAERLYGYTASEVLGRQSEFLEPRDKPGEVGGIVRRALAGEHTRMDTVRLAKSGEPVDISLSVFPVTDHRGNLLEIAAIHRDVTQGKRRLEEIKRLISIIDATPDFVASADPQGNILYLNRSARKMLGLPEDEDIIGRTVAQDHPPWTAPLLREGVRAALRLGQWEGESAILGPDRREIPTSQVILAHKAPDGAVQYFSTIARDITERKQAEESLIERTHQLATLLAVSYNVSSTLELEPLLGVILEQLHAVVDYSEAAILVLDGESLAVREYRGQSPRDEMLGLRFRLDEAPFYQEVLRTQVAVIDNDLSDASCARDCDPDRLLAAFPDARSRLGVPLQVKDRLIGLFCIDHREPGRFSSGEAELALAIANHAALAIENARLYEQARHAAAVEERQRLARELHDSVSQVLFGIGLGAHAASALVETKPGQAKEALEYIRSLADAGLTEMRALIFELRPESLEREGLVAALERQQEFLGTRHGVKVEARLCAEPPASLEVKEALYRIAREALQNVVKHALANEVQLTLQATGEGLVLEVRDNGVGFDPSTSFPGHLGLQSMRERAAQLGANIEIESETGRGTIVRISMPEWTSGA